MDRKDPWMHQGKLRHEGWDPRFEDFLTDVFLVDGMSETSIATLQVEVCAFNKWSLEATGRAWDAILPGDLQAYLQVAKDTLFASTFRKKRWCLRRLYKWAKAELIVGKNVDIDIARIWLPARASSRLPATVPSAAQMRKFLERPDTKTIEGIRDRAILELLYGAGLRAAELLGLPRDLHLQGRCMRLMGKGMKERLVILGEPALEWIAQYKHARPMILRRGGHVPQASKRLFVSSGRYPDYQYIQLWRMVRKHAAACGLDLTPHSLRHTFATHLYQGRAPLDAIRLLLGHQRLETTTIYVSRHGLDDHELVRQHHPRGETYTPFHRWGSANQHG
ncbi:MULTISPECIES: tyrosine-type recombinase/integrase [Delftia]|uniref:tyrosine-type recombinase/integrase n=1 Tax=Delftia TaxID=80865 RepID=UPI00135D8F9B|nr:MULTISPECIES: tyrosine-type recombinase/integrase [Delftia]MXN32793.1 tyrosine-type recombinase/integrase [Delftia sp. CH05]